ncbi:alpha-ketoacid dehydrogenase kinase [Hygrophoropsis aurantiaca]|uniref:Alpha-ketoacid dehydrogenase kinase n=1 Tax=Hygrophoropsis aurantiaca TaxID=72124 RepID=A0ACB8AMB6_9AGAM|nr:alpha-ketoacid dehydrogenase kinase [Hygrophoropsis aurantiaca]
MTWTNCSRPGLSGVLRRLPKRICPHTRSQSTALHFYQNRQLELFASKEAHRLTLRQLVFFGRMMDEDRLIKSANYVRTELPVRIAHRIRDLQALPYIVVTQEGVAKVYELYWSAFEKFRRYPVVSTLAENHSFCEFLEQILDEHAPVIPSLSLGLSLSSPHLPPDSLDSFMRRMLVSRISRRVLAEHHLALTRSFEAKLSNSADEPHVGIIYTGLSMKRSIDKCVELLRSQPYDIEDESGEWVPNRGWPEVEIDGHLDAKFAYIREHLEYIIFELLKNAMRATELHHRNASILPSIRATVVAGENEVGLRISDQGGGLSSAQIQLPSDLFSFSHMRNATRMDPPRLGALRTASSIGVKATVAEQIGRWQSQEKDLDNPQGRKDPEREAGIAPHPRIGLGLPMSNIFTTYFGGSLELVSMDGWGTDVYLRLPKLGTNLEGIEL